MEYYKNGKLLAAAFVEGLTEGGIGTAKSPGNLKVKGNQLIHYNTPIVERISKDEFILNITRYSQVTGIIQKWLKAETLADKKVRFVRGVTQDYVGSLRDFETKE